MAGRAAPLKFAGKALPIAGVATGVGVGIHEDVKSGASTEKIIANAGVNLAFDVGELGISIAAVAAAGSTVPIVGTIIGAVAGAGAYFVLESFTIDGKSLKEWVKSWLFKGLSIN